MWSRSEDDGGFNIAPDTEIPVDQTARFPVFERDFLWLGGKIVEEDDFSDDVLGDGFRKVNYNDIKSEIISVGFNSEDQEVVARYRVALIGIKHDLEP